MTLSSTIRALFSTVSPLSSHEVDGVRKEKERLTAAQQPHDLQFISYFTLRPGEIDFGVKKVYKSPKSR